MHVLCEVEAGERVLAVDPFLEGSEYQFLAVTRNNVEALLDRGEMPRDYEGNLLAGVDSPIEGGMGCLMFLR